MTYTANKQMNFQYARNTRELGGYVNEDGKMLVTGKILRGGDISKLTDEEMEQLAEDGFRVCIDMRIPYEREEMDPYLRSNELTYFAMPMTGSMDYKCGPEEILYCLYKDLLEHHRETIRRIMKIMAYETDSIIFHCTAGKDRTGVIAMLILAVCGVCEEQIIADYAASYENNLEQIAMQKRQLDESGLDMKIPDEIFQSDPKTMRMLLDYLNENYGGPVNYLKTIGMTEEEISKIRKKMLED
ncbi:MAG: tyrosine-protein phosphatase [Wujia sp.]